MKAITAKMLIVQKTLEHKIVKSSSVKYGKVDYSYVPLEDVVEKLIPVLNENNLLVYQFPEAVKFREKEHEPIGYLTTTIVDVDSGESVSSNMPLALSDNSSCSPQELGSAITYARRYALVSIFNFTPVGDDDDGVNATPKARGAAVRHRITAPPKRTVQFKTESKSQPEDKSSKKYILLD